MDLKTQEYIDLNFEEISPDKTISDSQFSNGLQHWRWSIAPTAGGCVVPHMSYFLIEYSFGAPNPGNKYEAIEALPQSSKIVLQNNWPACLYNACRFTAAQSEISVINSSHAQAHTLKQRMGRNNEFIESLGFDISAFDPDFSRRLARTCKDGVYHRDGVINCSPYLSPPLSSIVDDYVRQFTQAETPLPLVNDGLYYADSVFSSTPLVAGPNLGYVSSNVAFDPVGAGFTTANIGAGVVASFQWQLPDFSGIPGTPVQNATVIDGSNILKEDFIKFFVGTFSPQGVINPPTANETAFNALTFRVADKKINGTRTVLVLIPVNAAQSAITIPGAVVFSIFGNGVSAVAVSGVVQVERDGLSHNVHTQPDPRSNVVNNMIVYQPPVAFFDITSPNYFFGDMEISLTPNSNWAQACVESAVPNTYYGTDIVHGIDYSFGIKSMRLYLARARLLSVPEKSLSFGFDDILISNKQLPNGGGVLNFSIPPSTQKIICWIQDSAVGSNSKLPLTRFKTRQYTGPQTNTYNPLTQLNKFGPWAHTFDERLSQLQLNFAGITKTQTNFIRAGAGDGKNPTTNSMLQRWIMNNQMNDNRQSPEKYTDWLDMGPYYVYDFTRSSDNLGTYLTVNVNYDGTVPTDGTASTSSTPSTVNLYVACIYTRQVAMQYGEYGQIISVQTQMQ